MGVFEEEELWDSLIICYRLLQKLPQAQELVQARLQVQPLSNADSLLPADCLSRPITKMSGISSTGLLLCNAAQKDLQQAKILSISWSLR